MNKILFITAFLFVATSARSQIKVELQAGGSNFAGISVNAAKDLPLDGNGRHFLEPNIGLGILHPAWQDAYNIIHLGLHYKYSRFGIGSVCSWFFEGPFLRKVDYWGPDTRFILYPNANFTFPMKKWFVKLSAGAWFAFAEDVDYNTGKRRYYDEGDVLPGGGFSLGYAF